MIIRKANLGDIKDIMAIYDHALNYMQKNNNPNQWKKGYPGIDLIKADIKAGDCYLCQADDQTLGVFYFSIGKKDPTYQTIFQGTWLNEDPYGLIHRIATSKNKSGVGSFCIDYCYNQWPNIRIDTHRDNLPMRQFLTKKGFIECGLIYLADGSERIAYQKCQ